MLLFWTSCVLPHGFQIQSGYLACTLSCLHAVILKVTSGVTPAFSTNRGVHCISMYMAWQLVTFPTCHICNRGRLPGFDRETSCTVSRHVRDMVNVTSSSCKNCMVLIRVLVLKCMTANVKIFVKYVKSLDNVYADALSRGEIAYFKRKRKQFANMPTPVPREIWPIDKIWID